MFYRSTAMIPDYARGRESAIRILKLNNRQSKIDPQNGAGVIFVNIQKSIIFEIYLLNFCI
jgi:hypothetical protein